MVAVVMGGGLGLNLGSALVLGGPGVGGSASFGRQSDRVYVNAASGNLVVQTRDELLAGRGPDAQGLRTYNSLGAFVDDNGDNWQPGVSRKVWLNSGAVNTLGSVVYRRDEDGSEAAFFWDTSANTYFGYQGGGARDSLAYDLASGNWTFVDGSSRVTELYASNGRLLSTTDANGQSLSFAYNVAGLLSSVTTAAGEVTFYDYNASNQLTQLRTLSKSSEAAGPDRMLTRARYGYDTSNRLSTVTVDLSPEDNSVSDGRVFTSTYTYDGTSKRIASITQSDGAKLSFTYDTSARIKAVTDALGGVTTFGYDTANRATTVTDALNQLSTYRYDVNGQLLSVSTPAVNAVVSTVSYTYDATGNVTRITDAEGRAVTMDYDGTGNVIRQTDAAGNIVRRAYNAQNQLATETIATAGEPASTAPASRYVYDSSNTRLRFTISAEGRVSEYRYDAQGQRTSAIQYTAIAYATTGWAWASAPSETEMVNWVNVRDRTKTQRTDYAYDWRGQLTRSTSYDRVDGTGNGQGAIVTQYVYDTAGQLIKTIDARNGVTQSTYDGLGRLLTTTNALNQVSVNSYDDAGGSVRTTAFNGLVTTSTFDKLGRVFSVVETNTQGSQLGAAKSYYDADSRLRMTQDAVGNRQWFLYDDANRLVGQVNALGQLTETVYNKAGQVTQTIAYASLVNLPSLIDANGQPTNVSLASLRPAANAEDRKTWSVYNSAGRLTRSVSPKGEVSEFTYDASGRHFLTRRYVTPIDLATANLGSAPSLAQVSPTVTSQDQVLRSFYDNDGLLLGSANAVGSVSENQYDAAGRLVAKIQRTQVSGAIGLINSASTTVAQMRPADSTGDHKVLNFYNARGQLVAQLDGEGGFSETLYDATGNVSQTLRYSLKATGFNTTSLLSSIREAAGGVQSQTGFEYDLLNRVLKTRVDPNGLNLTTTSVYDDANGHLYVTAPNGTTTRTQFDAKGRATATTVEPNGLNLTIRTSYDANGRVATVTDPNGTVTLYAYDQLGRKTSQTVDSNGLSLTTTYKYDVNGNLARTIDPKGQHTRYLYDQDGRLQYVLDAEYGLTEYRHDALGNRVQSIRFADRQTGIQTVDVANGLIRNSFASISVNAAKDQVTRYVYDRAGLKRFEIDPLGAVSEYRYDAAGQLTQTLEYESTFGISGVPSETQMTALLVTTAPQFTSGLDGFSGDAGVWENGQLKLVSQPQSGGSWAQTNSPRILNAGASLKFDITPTQFQQTLHTMVESVSGTYNRLAVIWDSNGTMRVQIAAKSGSWRDLAIGNYSAGTTYTVEFLTHALGATVHVYAKGATRSTGLSYIVSGEFDWTQIRLAFATNRYPSLPDTTTAYVDNVEERAPDARVTRYAYDKAGIRRFVIDAERYVTEQRYDAAGRVVAAVEHENPWTLSGPATEAEPPRDPWRPVGLSQAVTV